MEGGGKRSLFGEDDDSDLELPGVSVNAVQVKTEPVDAVDDDDDDDNAAAAAATAVNNGSYSAGIRFGSLFGDSSDDDDNGDHNMIINNDNVTGSSRQPIPTSAGDDRTRPRQNSAAELVFGAGDDVETRSGLRTAVPTAAGPASPCSSVSSSSSSSESEDEDNNATGKGSRPPINEESNAETNGQGRGFYGTHPAPQGVPLPGAQGYPRQTPSQAVSFGGYQTGNPSCSSVLAKEPAGYKAMGTTWEDGAPRTSFAPPPRAAGTSGYSSGSNNGDLDRVRVQAVNSDRWSNLESRRNTDTKKPVTGKSSFSVSSLSESSDSDEDMVVQMKTTSEVNKNLPGKAAPSSATSSVPPQNQQARVLPDISDLFPASPPPPGGHVAGRSQEPVTQPVPIAKPGIPARQQKAVPPAPPPPPQHQQIRGGAQPEVPAATLPGPGPSQEARIRAGHARSAPAPRPPPPGIRGRTRPETALAAAPTAAPTGAGRGKGVPEGRKKIREMFSKAHVPSAIPVTERQAAMMPSRSGVRSVAPPGRPLANRVLPSGGPLGPSIAAKFANGNRPGGVFSAPSPHLGRRPPIPETGPAVGAADPADARGPAGVNKLPQVPPQPRTGGVANGVPQSPARPPPTPRLVKPPVGQQHQMPSPANQPESSMFDRKNTRPQALAKTLSSRSSKVPKKSAEIILLTQTEAGALVPPPMPPGGKPGKASRAATQQPPAGAGDAAAKLEADGAQKLPEASGARPDGAKAPRAPRKSRAKPKPDKADDQQQPSADSSAPKAQKRGKKNKNDSNATEAPKPKRTRKSKKTAEQEDGEPGGSGNPEEEMGDSAGHPARMGNGDSAGHPARMGNDRESYQPPRARHMASGHPSSYMAGAHYGQGPSTGYGASRGRAPPLMGLGVNRCQPNGGEVPSLMDVNVMVGAYRNPSPQYMNALEMELYMQEFDTDDCSLHGVPSSEEDEEQRNEGLAASSAGNVTQPPDLRFEQRQQQQQQLGDQEMEPRMLERRDVRPTVGQMRMIAAGMDPNAAGQRHLLDGAGNRDPSLGASFSMSPADMKPLNISESSPRNNMSSGPSRLMQGNYSRPRNPGAGLCGAAPPGFLPQPLVGGNAMGQAAFGGFQPNFQPPTMQPGLSGLYESPGRSGVGAMQGQAPSPGNQQLMVSSNVYSVPNAEPMLNLMGSSGNLDRPSMGDLGFQQFDGNSPFMDAGIRSRFMPDVSQDAAVANMSNGGIPLSDPSPYGMGQQQRMTRAVNFNQSPMYDPGQPGSSGFNRLSPAAPAPPRLMDLSPPRWEAPQDQVVTGSICKFHVKGHCPYGRTCKFVHPRMPPPPQPPPRAQQQPTMPFMQDMMAVPTLMHQSLAPPVAEPGWLRRRAMEAIRKRQIRIEQHLQNYAIAQACNMPLPMPSIDITIPLMIPPSLLTPGPGHAPAPAPAPTPAPGPSSGSVNSLAADGAHQHSGGGYGNRGQRRRRRRSSDDRGHRYTPPDEQGRDRERGAGRFSGRRDDANAYEDDDEEEGRRVEGICKDDCADGSDAGASMQAWDGDAIQAARARAREAAEKRKKEETQQRTTSGPSTMARETRSMGSVSNGTPTNMEQQFKNTAADSRDGFYAGRLQQRQSINGGSYIEPVASGGEFLRSRNVDMAPPSRYPSADNEVSNVRVGSADEGIRHEVEPGELEEGETPDDEEEE